MNAVKSIDLVDVAAKRLRDAGYQGVGVKRLSDIAKGGIAVRRLPATTTGTYYDGPRALSYLFQVVVIRESERMAIDECFGIASMLPHLNLCSENETYHLTSVEIYTDPQELELTDNGLVVWEVRFKALITTNERNN